MKLTAKLTALTLCMGLAGQAMATELKHWPADQAKRLETMIAANANKGNFAVFDMDNTSYRNDLEEALLPFMENRGLITRDTMDPSLKLIPSNEWLTVPPRSHKFFRVSVRTNLWPQIRDVVQMLKNPDKPVPYRLDGIR